jgi:hypothetical protein
LALHEPFEKGVLRQGLSYNGFLDASLLYLKRQPKL